MAAIGGIQKIPIELERFLDITDEIDSSTKSVIVKIYPRV